MSESRIESIILKNLFHNNDFTRKVLPYLKPEYFRNNEKIIFKHSEKYISEYNALPNISAIAVSVNGDKKVSEDDYKEILKVLETLETNEVVDDTWLLNKTEEFCKEKALANAAFKAVGILEGTDKKLDKGAIPHIFEEALAISFDPSVGHDYLEDAEARYDEIHSNEYKIPFDIDICNKVTKGGVAAKTLNVVAGGVYVGKTLALCHIAKSYMCGGKNALYITLEIAEKAGVGMRIDCNLLNLSVDEVDNIPKDVFMKRAEKARNEIRGKLIIKEYPAHSVHVDHFRALLHELKLKKKFIPDVILVDYLNLMESSRIKTTDQTHITILAIAEELRALAQEFGIPIWSATQLNAEGMESSSPKMTDVSQSKVGLIATVDLMWMLVCSEKLRELGQMLVIQHKNRYKDAADHKKFYIGLDRKKFRWVNVEQKGQTDPGEEIEEENIKQEVSKKYGQQPYESAYKNTKQARQFGPRGNASFKDFTI
jgi:replicative DNA helicase